MGNVNAGQSHAQQISIGKWQDTSSTEKVGVLF